MTQVGNSLSKTDKYEEIEFRDRSDQESGTLPLKMANPRKNVVYLTYLGIGEQGAQNGIWSLELLHDLPGADDYSRTTIFLVVVVKMDDRAVIRNNRLVHNIVRYKTLIELA